MSVEVEYKGRFGNNLFQYACARLFAEDNGLKLETPWLGGGGVGVRPAAGGEAWKGRQPKIRIGDPDTLFGRSWPPGHYVLDGFFQKASWYYARREHVRSFFSVPDVAPLEESHVVACVRLGDYWTHRIVIHPDWYKAVLGRLKVESLTVVTDEPGNAFHNVFSSYHPRIVSGSVADDFHLIRRARTLVLSNSSFSWWAAFMGHAQRMITFARWIDNPAALLSEFPGAEPVSGRFTHEC